MSKIYRESSINELMELINPDKPIFLDTETSKLGSQIRLVQCYQTDWDQVLLFDTTKVSLLGLWAVLQDKHLVGHNLGYDLNCFKRDLPKGVYSVPSNWEDTFYMARLAFPEWQKYSLDVCLTNVMGYDPYAPKLYDAVVLYTDDINHTLDKLTIEHGMELADGGMPIDEDRLSVMEESYYTTIADIDKQLPVGFNVNSYMQVRRLLGTQLSSDEVSLAIMKARPGGLTDLWFRLKMTNGKFPKAAYKALEEGKIKCELREFGVPHKLTDLGEVTSNRQLVYYQEIDYEDTPEVRVYADLVIKKRKALKRLNFVSRARANVLEDGRLHPTLSPHAISGRVQQQDENLTQYPRDMKTMFGLGTNSGKVLVYADYSQLELRTICAILPERNMEQAYRKGIDLHTFTAEKLTLDESQLPIGMGKRNVAKMCNFLNLYGGGVTNFQNVVTKFAGVWLEEDLVKQVTRDWFAGFSDIATWHKKNSSNKSKMDHTVLGRRYKADIVTDLNNIRVSGSGAEVAKLAMHYIYKYLIPKYKGSVRALNFVHDSFVLECPEDPTIYKQVARDLGICMFMGWKEAMITAAIPDLPMPVNVRVGTNWGDIEHDIFDYETDIVCSYEDDLEEMLNERT